MLCCASPTAAKWRKIKSPSSVVNIIISWIFFFRCESLTSLSLIGFFLGECVLRPYVALLRLLSDIHSFKFCLILIPYSPHNTQHQHLFASFFMYFTLVVRLTSEFSLVLLFSSRSAYGFTSLDLVASKKEVIFVYISAWHNLLLFDSHRVRKILKLIGAHTQRESTQRAMWIRQHGKHTTHHSRSLDGIVTNEPT